jgi:hypothetical protein
MKMMFSFVFLMNIPTFLKTQSIHCFTFNGWGRVVHVIRNSYAILPVVQYIIFQTGTVKLGLVSYCFS